MLLCFQNVTNFTREGVVLFKSSLVLDPVNVTDIGRYFCVHSGPKESTSLEVSLGVDAGRSLIWSWH